MIWNILKQRIMSYMLFQIDRYSTNGNLYTILLLSYDASHLFPSAMCTDVATIAYIAFEVMLIHTCICTILLSNRPFVAD